MQRSWIRVAVAFIAAAFVSLPVASARAQEATADIIVTIQEGGNSATFLKLLGDAGLIETLKGPGPFTVFVPSDEAFAGVPAERMAAFTKDRASLRQMLLYHIIAGKVTSADIARLNGRGTRTMQLTEAKVTVDDGTMRINNARITETDIVVRNGVIHLVDAVIIPPGGGR